MRLDVGKHVTSALYEILDRAERDRADRFVLDRDRSRFIVCRARLRQQLSARLGAAARQIEFAYGKHGKPELAVACAHSDLRFNVSHSEDLAVLAFAYGRDVGVDVEAIRELDDLDDIAARFFSRRESEKCLSLKPSEKVLGFFNCWTRKEAFIKAVGAGLHYPLDRFEVSLAPGEPARILRVGDIPGKQCGWDLESFSPAPGFVGAVTTRQAH